MGSNAASLLSALKAFCEQHGLHKRYYIAYSGGLDSHVLLSLCQQLQQTSSLSFVAIHIHHGLSPHADSWAVQCEQACKAWGITFQLHRVELPRDSGDSLEAVAREARYQVFANLLGSDDCLLTAHHQDDQAETVLLQLLRGAGLKGLAAMPVVKSLGSGVHARPLLAFTRLELQAYATEKSLQWVEDESNQQRRFTRNFLRHEIMPLLRARFPSVSASLARSAAHCHQSQVLLEEYAIDVLEAVRGSSDETLSVAKLLALDTAQLHLVLRTWMQQRGYSFPNTKKLATIRETVLLAAWDKSPCVSWGNVELRRHGDDVYLLSALSSLPGDQAWGWVIHQPLSLLGIGTLTAVPQQQGGISAAIASVQVRFRVGGETLPMPGGGRTPLKNRLQEWGVQPWLRDRIPLIFSNDCLIGVVGYWVDPAVLTQAGEPGWLPHISI